MSKTFDEYCISHNPMRLDCDKREMILCVDCELEWYKQRCEELESLLKESYSQHQDAILSIDKGIKALTRANEKIEELEKQISELEEEKETQRLRESLGV
jgi:BMFP domain-containing protein YqiC